MLRKLRTSKRKTKVEFNWLMLNQKTCQPEPNTNSTVKRRGITQNKCLDCGTSKLSTRAKRCLSCFATFRSDTKAKNRQVKKKPIPLSYPENLDVENEEANNVLQTVTPREDQSDATESLSPMKCVNKSRACNVCGKQVSPQSSGRCRSCYLGSRKRSAESSLELQSPIIQTPLPAIEVIDLTLDDDSEPETLEQPIKCSKCNKQRSEFKDHMCSDCYKKHKNNSTASNSQNDDVIFEVPAIPSARTSRSPIVSNVSAIDEHCSSTDYAVVPYSNLYYDLRVRPDTRNKCGSCGHSLKNGERRCSRCQSFHQANRTVAIYKQPRSEYSLDMRDTSSSSRALSVLSSTALTVSKVEKRKTSKCHACPTMIVPNKSGYCRACYNQFRHVASHSSPKKPKLPNSATNFEVSNDDEFNETTDRESSLMLPITQYRNQVLHTNNPADKQESSRAYYSEQLNESSDTNHNSFSDNYWTVV
ncbi:hypothetical protein M3Y94_00304700 [Aphelenchoides besseyi]|nr:hypothetical protein M3Y94_00304700 [Aphelenchoides besseyi]